MIAWLKEYWFPGIIFLFLAGLFILMILVIIYSNQFEVHQVTETRMILKGPAGKISLWLQEHPEYTIKSLNAYNEGIQLVVEKVPETGGMNEARDD